MTAPASMRRPGHTSAPSSDTWLTPRWILEPLGSFDLDPCAAPPPRPWSTAMRHLSLPEDDGLTAEWTNRVWLNPPYSNVEPWVDRLANHGHGTALLFARTDTRTFHRHVWPRASAVRFIRGRVNFCHPDGQVAKWNGGAPSILVAYGVHDAAALAVADIPGHFIWLGRST